jgi:hypothetical protein
MNTSRLVAGIAALAVGFGVTLVGVALADDEGADTTRTEASDDPTPRTLDDEVRQDDVDVTDPPDADVTEVSSPPTPPFVSTTSTIAREPNETNPAQTTTTIDLDQKDVDETDLDGIRCAETISVVYANGTRADYVVLETLDASSFLVLDVDGEFEVSARDTDVEELVLVFRNVRFFQGAAIEFLDVCTDLGGDEGIVDDEIESIRTDSRRGHTAATDQDGAL